MSLQCKWLTIGARPNSAFRFVQTSASNFWKARVSKTWKGVDFDMGPIDVKMHLASFLSPHPPYILLSAHLPSPYPSPSYRLYPPNWSPHHTQLVPCTILTTILHTHETLLIPTRYSPPYPPLASSFSFLNFGHAWPRFLSMYWAPISPFSSCSILNPIPFFMTIISWLLSQGLEVDLMLNPNCGERIPHTCPDTIADMKTMQHVKDDYGYSHETCHDPNSERPKIWPMTPGQRFNPIGSS